MSDNKIPEKKEWNSESKLDTIIDDSSKSNDNKILFKKSLKDQGLETLEEWSELTKEQKKKYLDGLVVLLDNAADVKTGSSI